MSSTTTAQGRNEFAPPPTPGLLRGLLLAIVAHGALVAMLAAGVQWKHTAAPMTAEAELWAAVPEDAAPPAPEPSAPVQAEPEPEVPPPAPKPAEPPAPVAPPPAPNADIAIAKEKARLKKEKLLQEEKLEQEKQAKLLKNKQEREKLEREKSIQAAKAALEAKEKAKQSAKPNLKAKEDAKKLDELRQQNLKRMAGLAGSAAPSGNGDARSTGTAAQSSGPSSGYGGRIRARIKPNITYTDTLTGNPTAEVEVRTSPDGTIISRKLTQSSGVKSWDDAVLNAIDKTEKLPSDTDGRVPSSLIISFRPRD
jgi:colicin import membrane protein